MVDKDLTFLTYLIFSYRVQISETFVQEGCDILDLLQDLGIVRLINKTYELTKYGFDVSDFLMVACNDSLLIHESLLFPFVFTLKLGDNLFLLLDDLPYQFREAIFNVVELSLHQSFQLLSNLG